MHKLIVLHYITDDPQEARRYYRDIHMPIAARTPGLQSCRFSLAPVAPDGSTPFFCVYEATFASGEAMAEAFKSDIAREVVADAANFSFAGSIVQHFDFEPYPPDANTTPQHEAKLHKVLVLHRMPQNPEEAREYYLNSHLPLAAKTPGQLWCQYSFNPVGMDRSTEFFCVYEGFFPDKEAMISGLKTGIGQQVVADAANFADNGSIVLNYQLENYPICG